MKKVTILLLVLSPILIISCLSYHPSSAIITAAQDGKFERVKQLTERGADINEKNRYGDTALERAASNGHFEIVEYLLIKNAGNTQKAFQNALRNNHTNIAKLFIDGEHIDVNNNAQYFRSLLNNNQLPFEQRLQNVKNITGDKLNSPYLLTLVDMEHYQLTIDFFKINLENKTDVMGNSILHTAAMLNNLNLVKYLLENNFYVNVLDNNNHTALFYCITSFGPSINWNNPVIEDEETAKINYVSSMPQYRDPNDFRIRQATIGIMLLDAGVNVNQQNKFGWTVLHFASASYPVGPIETLIEKGADQNLETGFGRTSAAVFELRR
jgi:ankyrin repeat protein